MSHNNNIADIRIRQASLADLPALTEIYNAAILDRTAAPDLTPRTLEERGLWWDAHLDERFPVLVAEADGALRGYAALSSWVGGAVYAHTAEAGIYLDPAAQGQGLGTRLMRELLVEAQRRGHHVVIARVWAENAPSLSLCRRCGFEEVGIQRQVGWRRGAWEDCVLLQKILPGVSESSEV